MLQAEKSPPFKPDGPISKLVCARQGFCIDCSIGDAGQILICLGFFLECLIQKRCGVVQAENQGPAFERAVTGDFIMLHRLRGSEQTGVEGGAALVFFDDLVALGQYAFDCVAGLATRRLADDLEDLLKAFDLAFGLILVLGERGLQFRRLSGCLLYTSPSPRDS